MDEIQLKSGDEPAEISQPRPNRFRRLLVAGCVLFALAVCGIWAANYLTVDKPLKNVLSADPRNHVCKARAHFGGWLDPEILVYDVTGVSADASRLDIFRTFLEYAEAMKDHHFTKVVLASHGTSKFSIDGNYFQELGREYSTQNPMYTIRTFPPHLAAMDGTKPFSEYEGGILGVLQKEMEQFTEFSNEWYLTDFQTGSSASAAGTTAASFDPCESLRESNPHCGWKPHWEDSGTSVNPIDGSKTEFLSMESTDADGVDFDKMHFANLRICFKDGTLCGGKTIGVGITVHGMLASVGYESEYSTPVRLKFDDDKPVSQTWGISDSHDALFPSGKEGQFLSQLIQHNKLVLEFSYYEKAARTVTFDITGLADKMKSANLAAVAPLHVTLQGSQPAPNAKATETEMAQADAHADLDEAGPKPTTQARTDAQCPRIENGTFVFSPSPSGHYWKFCSNGEHPVCFSKETTDMCFK
jgi:hypothetical protein